MATTAYPKTFVHQSFLLSCFFLISICSVKPLCTNKESFALLQFKQSFLVNKYASNDPLAYPKVASWKHNNDCCLWDGVECDEVTGHVIGLDLSSSFLYGSLNSSSSLFHLVHLQKLNLGDNYFNFSEIPSKLSILSRLTYLNLSYSAFHGQIPSLITKLSKLTSLDLGRNVDPLNFDDTIQRGLLHLKSSDLRILVQNFTSLHHLDLSFVNISSTMPNLLPNLSSLTSLNLEGCNLQGLIPSSLGDLTKLAYLNLRSNQFSGQIPSSLRKLFDLNHLLLRHNQLTGKIPSWLSNLTKLHSLDLGINKLHGTIPESIGKLVKLVYFDVVDNSLSGQLPSFADLTKLESLSLSNNNFVRLNLSWLGKQNKLTYLELRRINLVGEIPSSMKNLTSLGYLSLAENQLTGPIPLWLSNLTQLSEIYLGHNELHGTIPEFISKLVILEVLDVESNYLSGTVKFDLFTSLKHLTSLHLVNNNLSLLTQINSSATLPKFTHLGLSDCNLDGFPEFLRHQDELIYLSLSRNNIRGQIPRWLGNVNGKMLSYLSLARNFITGFEQSSDLSSLTNLHFLSLSHNNLQGSLPIPPHSLHDYKAANNSFTGEISQLFCNFRSLTSLDLSYNSLTGIIPPCLGNLSDSLLVLNLANNFFTGSIPELSIKGCNLKMVDVSHNQLRGQLPSSLASCGMLEILDVSKNHITDKFPSWLGTLPSLQVVSLRSNQFFGAMGTLAIVPEFVKLRIVDLSYNNFSGVIPSDFFQSLSDMKTTRTSQFTYMQASQTEHIQGDQAVRTDFTYHLVLANKGFYLNYEKIPNSFAAIDLSSNRFRGEIPPSIGTLNMVYVLNLSNNHLSGNIPPVLGKLENLESLDLSHNMLLGEIPFQLSQLTFLEYLNVSHNQLVGPIPKGNQFDTFDNSSYLGNSGLCGNPLSKKCEDSESSPPSYPSSLGNEDSNLLACIGWKTVLIGYGCGLVLGVIGGHIFSTRNYEWLLTTFKLSQRGRKKRTAKRPGRR